ncbi:putative ribonuclease H-like domain-containing protein [Tanacetum coccineum]
MCDKKNSVLFTDTGCFVLSPDFKLADESQVLLKVPRKNNMYSVDMKNIVPKECLTCLVAKATLNESMLWHMRLGHVNFKTIDKLVKENLAEAVNTACYVQNRVLVVKPHNKTPYELFRGRTPAISFMRPFGCHVTILNTLDYLGKFDGKSDKGFFVGYLLNSKAFRVYNIRTRKVEENLHIRFLEDKPIIACDGPKWRFDIGALTKSMNYVPVVADGSLFDSSSKNVSNDEPQPSSDARKKDDEGVRKESGIDDQEGPKNSTQAVNTTGPSINTASINVNTDISNITTTYLVPSTPNTRIYKDHSLDHVIGDVQSGVQTRRMTKTTNEQGFISVVYEGKTHEDLHTYLFACFLSQEEPKRITKALSDSAWVEAMQEELLYAFLYGRIEEEVYVCQPPRFEDPDYPDKVYKVRKDRSVLLYQEAKGDILLVQVYVDDIIFGSTKKELCTEFEKLMHEKFQMSSIGELTFFLGLQVKQKEDGIFISQDKYVTEIKRKFVYGRKIFNTVYKEVHTFVPMGTEVESERTKRAGQNLQQESSKKQKTGEASESAKEQKEKEADELSQEEL